MAAPIEAEGIDELIDAIRVQTPVADAHPMGSKPRFPGLIGESRPMRELVSLIEKVAETDSTVLVTGETGSGKELVGDAVHQASLRRDRVFCAVNSAAFPETLLESELFGHRRGAFTGAANNSKGLFESARPRHGVPRRGRRDAALDAGQAAARSSRPARSGPVGGDAIRFVDVRLVTATNKDLESEVEAGRFREDLYYRLAVIPIHVPPLRERRSRTFRCSSQHFLARLSEKSAKPVVEIDEDALDILMSYDWPGNVRQLQNVIERGVALCPGERITMEDLPRRFFGRRAAPGGFESLPSMERRHILETLDKVGWNRRRAADILQISTTTLWRRLKEFGIDGDPRPAEGHLSAGG